MLKLTSYKYIKLKYNFFFKYKYYFEAYLKYIIINIS